MEGAEIIKRNIKEDFEELRKICKEYEVENIICGLPKNMNGTIGAQAEKVQEFCELLKQEVQLPIKMWDERLSTSAAHRAMIEGDLSRVKRKKIVDKLAAVYILQGYLDSL